MSKQKTVTIRIRQEDKQRFDELQRELTIKNGGVPVTSADVLNYLLETEKGVKRMLSGQPPENWPRI